MIQVEFRRKFLQPGTGRLSLTALPTEPNRIAKAKQKFQLDNSKPEIGFTGEVQVYIRVNGAAGPDLVDDDSFHVSAKVRDHHEVEQLGLTVIDQRR